MSDKDSQGGPRQLTVAELLARSGGSTPAQRPPRRHRSIDEGGISVAELTGDLPKVAEKPIESRHSSVPIDGQPATDDPEVREPATDDPKVRESTDDRERRGTVEEAEADGAPASTVVMSTVVDEREAAEGAGADEGGRDDGYQPAADLPVATGRGGAAVRVSEAVADEEDADAEDDSEGSGVGSVILLAVVGIVIGALVFLGFQQLWESDLARLFIAILGLLVTGLFIGVVHALRTTRDGLSMTLAGLVGLLMTFGPCIPLLL